MNYGSSFIQVRHNGFSITGPQQADAGGETGTSVPGLAKERSRQRSEEAEPECVAYQMEVKEYDSLSAFKEETGISVPLPDLELLGGEAADQSVHIVGDQVYIRIQEEQGRLEDILKEHLGLDQVTLIKCGSDSPIDAAREQWSDGSNTLAIAPGEVVVYERNYVTNRILEDHGITVHTIPCSELSRGRGGPRCMSMPFVREDV